MSLQHKVHIYKEYHSVCPIVGIGTLPPLLSRLRVCPSPRNQRVGVGSHSLRVRSWEGPNSDEWRKRLALCLLCAWLTRDTWENLSNFPNEWNGEMVSGSVGEINKIVPFCAVPYCNYSGILSLSLQITVSICEVLFNPDVEKTLGGERSYSLWQIISWNLISENAYHTTKNS